MREMICRTFPQILACEGGKKATTNDASDSIFKLQVLLLTIQICVRLQQCQSVWGHSEFTRGPMPASCC